MNTIDEKDSTKTHRDRFSYRIEFLSLFWIVLAGAFWILSHQLLEHFPESHSVFKWLISLSPFGALLLCVQSNLRQIRGMDELQRRIQMEAWLFAAMGTVFVGTAINTLHENGLLRYFFESGLGMSEAIMTMFMLLILGKALADRRYR